MQLSPQRRRLLFTIEDKIIMTQVAYNLSNHDYHANTESISSSGLRLIARSPLHYWDKYLNPDRVPTEPTPAMKFGTAWHSSVFEPHKFDTEYAIIPEGLDRRTKEGKQLYADIEATGKSVLTHEEALKLSNMHYALHRHPRAHDLLTREGHAEVSMLWVDYERNISMKIRPDWYIEPCDDYPYGAIIDGKTTTDASPAEFAKSVWNYGYLQQAAFYVDGFQKVFNTEHPPVFILIAQEKDSPYAVGVYQVSDKELAFGRQENERLLDLYATCREQNYWPAYSTEIDSLDMPAWAARIIDPDGDDEVMEFTNV
jgi:exodeoxyribonuclease VIII